MLETNVLLSILSNKVGIDIKNTLLLLPAIIIALTFHEFAHAITAYALGDDTAKKNGRLTLNPIKHIDPIGFIMLILVRVGWAKPVPMDTRNFKRPKLYEILTALAGPFMNILLSIVFALLTRLMLSLLVGNPEFFNAHDGFTENILVMLQYGMIINITLCIFNMLPVPPLDGSHFLTAFISGRAREILYKVQPFVSIAFLIIWFSGLSDIVIMTPTNIFYGLLLKYIVGI